MITDTKHDLRFGPLDLKGQVAAAGYWMYALGEGATLGNPVPIEQSLASQLMDGSVSRRTGYGNRTPGFDVVIAADDSIALAKGQAALDLACASPGSLLFTPPDGLGFPTYFEVVTAHAEWLFDDWEELHLYRTFRVTFNCLPFGKSLAPVTDAVAPVEEPAAEQEVNDCDSLTGFTGLSGSTAVLDTAVKVEGTGSVKMTGQTRTVTPYTIDGWYRQATETGTVELTGLSLTTPATRPFISFKGYVGDCVNYAATLHANGEAAEFVSLTYVDASWAELVFRTHVTDTITSLRFTQTLVGNFPYDEGSPGFGIPAVLHVPATWAPRVDDIRRNGAPSPFVRQQLRSVPIRGSARTQGSLAISHPTDGLGKVLLLTTPSLSTGFDPTLMQWCTNSPSADAGSISGKVKVVVAAGTLVNFEFPAASIPPGGFQLLGFMETGTLAAGNAVVEVTAATKVGAVTLSAAEHRQRIEATGNGVFEFVDCGPITLPTTDVPAGSTATVVLTVTLVGADGVPIPSLSASFQEFYLIPLADDTSLNIFDCGTGTAEVGVANNRLWIDSATLASGNPSAWMGTAEDRTDAYHAASEAMRWMPLSLKPPEVLLFMANSGGANANATLTHTPSWHGLAAE